MRGIHRSDRLPLYGHSNCFTIPSGHVYQGLTQTKKKILSTFSKTENTHNHPVYISWTYSLSVVPESEKKVFLKVSQNYYGYVSAKISKVPLVHANIRLPGGISTKLSKCNLTIQKFYCDAKIENTNFIPFNRLGTHYLC